MLSQNTSSFSMELPRKADDHILSTSGMFGSPITPLGTGFHTREMLMTSQSPYRHLSVSPSPQRSLETSQTSLPEDLSVKKETSVKGKYWEFYFIGDNLVF